MAETPETARGEIVLEARRITKTYGGVRALDDVSLVLRAGEVHSLAGENGSGKSTLIKIISGAEAPDAGELVIAGERHTRMSPARAIHAGVQVIYQDFSLFPNLTVGENIVLTRAVARRQRVFSARASRPLAEQIVAELGLDLDLDADVEKLSVADRQLTAICRALVNEARVIFMDEPTTALTHSEVERLFAIVRRLQDRGVAVVIVSHKLEEMFALSQRITVLRNGRAVASEASDAFDRHRLIHDMTGKELDESRRVSAIGGDGSALLDVEGLGVEGAFQDVSFGLRAGEILGITGLLGSGRSEIVESIFGVISADRGRIRVAGADTAIRSIRDAIRAGIGYVPEDRLTQGLFLEKPIADNIIASSLGRMKRWGIFLDRARISETIGALFVRLRIKAPSVQAPVRSLSGGNAQRVVLAKWLASRPRILMLNGPTVGVDVGSKGEILDILRQEAAEGMGVIVVSDDVPELVAVCHRVLVVRGGRIVQEVAGDGVDADRIQEAMAA
ncbi:sugar ABC transporter ATP-binding protein [Microbacterium sp. G2-8]|uniref:sugar ABC transporter ATP-binding protein n=1 Tax=Microbacterium sp. G2-8 TaxID=2842454 RepID=UPI001C89AC3C|nr:sugar ABC transporter ATP-binding protein [Microbacterium sp. G2-8]